MPYLFDPKKKHIVIAHPSRKDYYLKKKYKSPYLDLTVMSLPELRALFDYNYDDRALRYLLGKGYKYLVAKGLLEAFTAPDFEKGVEVQKYSSLRNELIMNKLLFKTAYPEKTFENASILISGYYNEGEAIFKYIRRIPGMLEVGFDVEEQKDPSENEICKFIDPYEELHFVYNKIAYDLDVNKTPIDNIYVYGLSGDYVPLINEFNKMYGFTIGIKLKERLYDQGIYKHFREVYLEKGLEDAISSMREKYPEEKDGDTIERFAREFAVVFEKDPAKTVSIYDDIAKEKEPYDPKYKNMIKVLDEPVCPPDAHLYCLNFSMGTYPKVSDESGLFSDKEKALIGLTTSKEKSLNDSVRVDALLKSKSVKLITFFELGFDNHFFLSGFKTKYGMKVISNPVAEDENGPYEYAHDKGGFLFAALEDEYQNYLTDDKRREAYKKVSALDGYRKYDYTFKGKKILRGKRRYAASNLENYNLCPFKYLLGNVLYLDDSPSDFRPRIGNVFHKTLEMYHDDEAAFDFNKAYDLAISYEEGLIPDPKANPHEKKVPFSEKEKALIENLRSYCSKSLDFQKQYEAGLKNPKFLAEGTFNINFDDITVTGRYDKVITFDFNDERYALIVDYKTGGAKFDEAAFNEFGLSLQLPIYAFALEKEKANFDNAKIAGLFISPILAYDLIKDVKNMKKTMAEIDQSKSRLMGLYLSDMSFIRVLDPGLTSGNSTVIDGCEIKKNDEGFIQRAEFPKNKTSEEFHALAEKAEAIIREADTSIMEGHFEIDPTIVKGRKGPCESCPFHDVCFVDKKKLTAKNLSKNNMDPDSDEDESDTITEEEE